MGEVWFEVSQEPCGAVFVYCFMSKCILTNQRKILRLAAHRLRNFLLMVAMHFSTTIQGQTTCQGAALYFRANLEEISGNIGAWLYNFVALFWSSG